MAAHRLLQLKRKSEINVRVSLGDELPYLIRISFAKWLRCVLTNVSSFRRNRVLANYGKRASHQDDGKLLSMRAKSEYKLGSLSLERCK